MASGSTEQSSGKASLLRIESSYSWLDLHIEKMTPILRVPVKPEDKQIVKKTEASQSHSGEAPLHADVSVSVSDAGREQSVDAHYSRRVDYSVDFTIVHQV